MIFNNLFLVVCMCMDMCKQLQVSMKARGVSFPGAQLQVVISCLVLMLGTELESSLIVSTINH